MINLNNKNTMATQTGSDNPCRVRGLLNLKSVHTFLVNSFNTFKSQVVKKQLDCHYWRIFYMYFNSIEIVNFIK